MFYWSISVKFYLLNTLKVICNIVLSYCTESSLVSLLLTLTDLNLLLSLNDSLWHINIQVLTLLYSGTYKMFGQYK